MIQQKVLYTDGHEVTVTDSQFIVKKSLYQLKGITNHGFLIIHPDRFTPFLLLISGMMMITMGAFHMVPVAAANLVHLDVDPNLPVMGLGGLVFIAASLVLGFKRDRYAIRIATAEGEKNVVVSRKKEYINQILEALNHAFLNLVTPGRQQALKPGRK